MEMDVILLLEHLHVGECRSDLTLLKNSTSNTWVPLSIPHTPSEKGLPSSGTITIWTYMALQSSENHNFASCSYGKLISALRRIGHKIEKKMNKYLSMLISFSEKNSIKSHFLKEKIEKINRRMYMYYILLFLPLVTGCQYIPDMAKDIESIATDTAIRVEISRETFLKETDLEININVQNKDEPVVKAPKEKS